MAEKEWFESIRDRVPSTTKFEFTLPELSSGLNLVKTLFREPFDLENVNVHLTPITDLMEELEGFGFQDKGNYYEMVTDLGGQRGEAETPEDAVKVELTGKDNRTVEITYEHSTSTDKNCFYSHSQKTSVMLPADADDNTLKARFNDDGNVVIWVKKKVKEPEKTSRTIPIGRTRRDR